MQLQVGETASKKQEIILLISPFRMATFRDIISSWLCAAMFPLAHIYNGVFAEEPCESGGIVRGNYHIWMAACRVWWLQKLNYPSFLETVWLAETKEQSQATCNSLLCVSCGCTEGLHSPQPRDFHYIQCTFR